MKALRPFSTQKLIGEPPNPSLYYYIQVILSPKRVSSCEGIKTFLNPKTVGFDEDIEQAKAAARGASLVVERAQ